MKILSLMFFLVCVGLSARAAHHSPSKKSHIATASRHSTSRARGKSGRKRKGGSRQTASARRHYQQAPSSDRYKEIQEALIAKGYLKSSADGTWNADSADALKRFQADQNLSTTGKVNSLSLIALGLGPKSEPSSKTPPAKP